jgi:hypothetical protein
MLDDEDNAGAALPGCGRLRAVRPGAFVQSVSPCGRNEPIGLAPRDASPDTASCRIIDVTSRLHGARETLRRVNDLHFSQFLAQMLRADPNALFCRV